MFKINLVSAVLIIMLSPHKCRACKNMIKIKISITNISSSELISKTLKKPFSKILLRRISKNQPVRNILNNRVNNNKCTFIPNQKFKCVKRGPKSFRGLKARSNLWMSTSIWKCLKARWRGPYNRLLGSSNIGRRDALTTSMISRSTSILSRSPMSIMALEIITDRSTTNHSIPLRTLVTLLQKFEVSKMRIESDILEVKSKC